MLLHVSRYLDCCRSAFRPGPRYISPCLTSPTAFTFWRVRCNVADAYRYGKTVAMCHVPCPFVTMQSTSNTTVWLQVMRWLASTDVDNEVDLEADDANGVSS